MGHNFEFIGPAEGAKGDPPPACVRCGQDEELVALGVRLHVLYSLNVLLTHGGPQLRHIITFINKNRGFNAMVYTLTHFYAMEFFKYHGHLRVK